MPRKKFRKEYAAMRLTKESIEWLDKKAKENGVSRTAIVEMIIRKNMKKGGEIRV